MAKKKQQSKEPDVPSTAKPKRTGIPLNAWLPKDVGKQFLAYIAAQEIPPTATAVAIAAVREFLAKRGFWPPGTAREDD